MRKPLYLFGTSGLVLTLLGIIIGIYLTIKKLVYGVAIGNEPLLLLGVLLIIIGAQFISLGLIGESIISVAGKGNKEYVIKKEID